MLQENIFSGNELRACDWQYVINLTKVSDFKVGNLVFLKSNPEVPLLITKLNLKSNEITVNWLSNDGIPQFIKFKPHMILPYKYAGLMKYKNFKFIISLN